MELMTIFASIAATINLAGLVWSAAKMHSAMEMNRKTASDNRETIEKFKSTVLDKFENHTDKIARIDIRVSLLEQESDTLTPPERNE